MVLGFLILAHLIASRVTRGKWKRLLALLSLVPSNNTLAMYYGVLPRQPSAATTNAQYTIWSPLMIQGYCIDYTPFARLPGFQVVGILGSMGSLWHRQAARFPRSRLTKSWGNIENIYYNDTPDKYILPCPCF